MAELVTVAKTTELEPGQAKAIQVKGETVALFNIGGTYYAINDTCTHSGGPLSEGEIEGSKVTCPWHGAQFDIASGKVLSPPAPAGVKNYTIHIEGDNVQLEI